MHCKSFSHFFNKKYLCIWEINFWNFNETLTNNVVSFEQPGPDVFLVKPDKLDIKRLLHGFLFFLFFLFIIRRFLGKNSTMEWKVNPVLSKLADIVPCVMTWFTDVIWAIEHCYHSQQSSSKNVPKVIPIITFPQALGVLKWHDITWSYQTPVIRWILQMNDQMNRHSSLILYKWLISEFLEFFRPGPGCWNFQMLISQIRQYFLLKKCEKLLHCKSASHFFNKNFQCIWLLSGKTLNELTS